MVVQLEATPATAATDDDLVLIPSLGASIKHATREARF
jgi:hypothetical protein